MNELSAKADGDHGLAEGRGVQTTCVTDTRSLTEAICRTRPWSVIDDGTKKIRNENIMLVDSIKLVGYEPIG